MVYTIYTNDRYRRVGVKFMSLNVIEKVHILLCSTTSYIVILPVEVGYILFHVCRVVVHSLHSTIWPLYHYVSLWIAYPMQMS